MPVILDTPKLKITAECNNTPPGVSLTIEQLPNGTINHTLIHCDHGDAKKLFNFLWHLRAPRNSDEYEPTGDFSMKHFHVAAPEQKVTETVSYSELVEQDPEGDYEFEYDSEGLDHSTTPPTQLHHTSCKVKLKRADVLGAANALSRMLQSCCPSVDFETGGAKSKH